MNGDQVRDTWFCTPRTRIIYNVEGYVARQVDDLLRDVAAELDTGRPAGPLIENATLRKRGWGSRYDIDAVDWFLGQFLLPPDRLGRAGTSTDPWGDLPVAQLAPGGISGPAKLNGVHKPWQNASRAYFASQCKNAWRDFDLQPGTHLRWVWTEGDVRRELRTAEQQTLASSVNGFWRDTKNTFSAGGRSFTFNTPKIPAASTADSWPPGLAELARRSGRDDAGRFAAGSFWDSSLLDHAREVGELVDETGTPILYTSGTSFRCRASASVTFPDQRWLRFLVRGTRQANAIMTAVDQAGNRVARYRSLYMYRRRMWEIIVHPDWKLTDELALALATSTELLGGYFATGGSM